MQKKQIKAQKPSMYVPATKKQSPAHRLLTYYTLENRTRFFYTVTEFIDSVRENQANINGLKYEATKAEAKAKTNDTYTCGIIAKEVVEDGEFAEDEAFTIPNIMGNNEESEEKTTLLLYHPDRTRESGSIIFTSSPTITEDEPFLNEADIAFCMDIKKLELPIREVRHKIYDASTKKLHIDTNYDFRFKGDKKQILLTHNEVDEDYEFYYAILNSEG